VAGFVGVAQKGPLDQPTLLRGWSEFVDVFGNAHEGYLARAVEGFFLNGGEACYVVRIAHRPRGGELPGADNPACAELIIKDAWDKPTIRVRALDEGKWGNNIWVRFQQNIAVRTLLTLDLELGAGEARVNSIRGLERGALVLADDAREARRCEAARQREPVHRHGLVDTDEAQRGIGRARHVSRPLERDA
jgi:hypothetical protein